MALVKRGRTWHTHFFVDGQRFRQSLETSDWREAQAREKGLIVRAAQGKLAPASQKFSKLNITEAIERYLADRAAHVQPRSRRSESDHAKPLREYFGCLPVSRIDVDSILAYVRQRTAKGLSNTTVNMEIGILRRILKRAKRWHFVEDEVPRLPERRDIGRALQPDEKLRLLRVAQSRPEWETAYLASLLALNTTMRGCEIKQLQWRDIDFMDRSLTIHRSKTRAGERVIPLNANAYNAILAQGTCSNAFRGRSTGSLACLSECRGLFQARSDKANERLAFRLEKSDTGSNVRRLRRATETLDDLLQRKLRCRYCEG